MRVLSAVSSWLDKQGNGNMQTITIQHVAQRGPEPEHIKVSEQSIDMVMCLAIEDDDSPFAG